MCTWFHCRELGDRQGLLVPLDYLVTQGMQAVKVPLAQSDLLVIGETLVQVECVEVPVVLEPL